MGTSLINRDYNGKDSYKVTKGIVTVFGYVKDKVGNEGYCSKEIKVDNTKPTGTIYMGYEVYPKEDTTVTTTKMTIKNINKYEGIDGIRVHFKKTGYGKITWTAGGKIESKIFAGNTANIMIDETINTNQLVLNVSSMTPLFGSISAKDIDKVEILKQENETSIWTNKDVTVYVSARDTITGVSDYSFDNGVSFQNEKTKSYSDNTTGVVKIKDQVGNVSIGYSFTIDKIDKVAPTVSFTNPKDGVWTNSNIKFTVNATDDASGIEGYYYSYNDSTNYVLNPTGEKYDFSYERQDVANIVVCDNAGNCTNQTTNIWIDKTAPSLTINNPTNGNWTNKPFSLTLTGNDQNGSGIRDYAYKYTSTNYTTYANSAKTTFTTTEFSTERNEWAYLRVCDKAGNCSFGQTWIAIDKTAPTFSFTNPKDGVWTNSNISFTINATDNASGIEGYYYSYDNKTYNKDVKDMVFSAQRNNTAYLRVCDNVGNCSTKTTAIKIDKTNPRVETLNKDSWNLQLVQHDSSGNTLTSKIISKSCNDNTKTCYATLCVTNAAGSMTVTPYYPFSFKDDQGPLVLGNYINSGINSNYSSMSDNMYNKNGIKTSDGSCLKTRGDNPCTWIWKYSFGDNAGNKVTDGLTIQYTIGYIGADSFCG